MIANNIINNLIVNLVHQNIQAMENKELRALQYDGCNATVPDAPLPLHFIGGAPTYKMQWEWCMCNGCTTYNMQWEWCIRCTSPKTPISGRAVMTAAFKAYHWSSPPKHNFVCNSHAHYISNV
ncbi:hypothetical protein EVAR_86057_1 [Eumeta japonica]|uniref:RanBP2-type domain-containing protein n=1 Tax=Eumeta variegata TaxID=151549 RepID=A0A4C1UKZ4_EUMVA|nr:hypothetical protein EVAR_86057_1 [Eumeta japonica]